MPTTYIDFIYRKHFRGFGNSYSELGLKQISEVEIFGIGLHQDVVGLAFAKIMWFGRRTEIEVLINDGGDDRLLGSELLDGKILRINDRKKTVNLR